jgi:hypothetical protein
MLKRVELYLYFMRTWVRPSLRELLNCTDRCPCSLILVPSSRLPRSRSRTNGQPSSITCWRSWELRQRDPRSRFLATLHFTSLLTWPGDGTCSEAVVSRSRFWINLVLVHWPLVTSLQLQLRGCWDLLRCRFLFDKGHRMGKVWSERKRKWQ